MTNESLSRDHVLWGIIVLLSGLALFHQVASAIKTDALYSVEAAELVWSQSVCFEADAFTPPPLPPLPMWEVTKPVAFSVKKAPPLESDQKRASELLIEAIIQIESAGNPKCVGPKGERGLMQIKRGTWKDMTSAQYGKPVSYSEAFNPALNRHVGRLYLNHLQKFIRRHHEDWRADERSLLLAAYNAGPNALLKAKFNIDKLSTVTRSYVRRGSDLHAYYLRVEMAKSESIALLKPAR